MPSATCLRRKASQCVADVFYFQGVISWLRRDRGVSCEDLLGRQGPESFGFIETKFLRGALTLAAGVVLLGLYGPGAG